MNIQWYPHHMARAKEKLKEKLELIDVVIEVLDARIPMSSKNADLEELLAEKKKVIVLNKRDLADPGLTKRWVKFFSELSPVVRVNSLAGEGIKKLLAEIEKLMEASRRELTARGIDHKDIRLMVVGIPNVGKSQLINQLSKQGRAKTGNKPGVTRGQQWVKLRKGLQLLDTPGILWPKFEAEEVGFKLAACGAIKEGNFDGELLAYKLVEVLKELAPHKLKERFKLQNLNPEVYDLIAEMGKNRGCLQSGGKVNRERISNLIIREFREGKLGRVTLERPRKFN